MSGDKLESINVSGISIKGPGAKFVIIADDDLPMFFVDSFKFCTWIRGEVKFDSLIHSKVVPSRIELSDNLIISSLPDGKKKLKFNIDAISDDFTRTIFMPDNDVYLGNMPDFILLNEGDLLTRDATQLIALPIGPEDWVLKSNGTLPEWSNIVARLNQGQTDVVIAGGSYTVQDTDSNTISVTTSAGNSTVILPDATTLPDGWEVTINNAISNTENLTVQDNQNVASKVYGPDQSVVIRLIDNSTQAGTWSFSEETSGIPNVIIVAKSGGDYTTITAAMNAVTAPSIANKWVIKVGPGTYVEPPIVMKEYVNIEAIGEQTVTIVTTNPAGSIFTVANGGQLHGLTIVGAAAGRGVYVNAVSNFKISACIIANNNIGIDIGHPSGTPGVTRLQLFDNTFENNITNSIRVTGATAGPELVTFVSKNNIYRGSSNPASVMFSGSGPRVLIFMASEAITGDATGGMNGTCLQITDGSQFVCDSFLMQGFNTGISIPNIGAAPTLNMTSIGIQLTNNHVVIDHPGATGYISGTFNQSKSIINPATQFSVTIQDTEPGSNGIKIVGDLYLGRTFDSITNFSPHINDSSMLGKLSGGSITIAAGTSVDVSSGQGYLRNNAGELQLTEWAATNIVLPPSSRRYVYVDVNANVLFASARPDQNETILLGRVGTLAVSVEFIDRSNLNSNSIDILDDKYIRNVFGGLYASGSLVTNNVSDNLQVTSGRFYFANNEFNPSGLSFGNSWFIYHNVGGVMGRQGIQTVVDNLNYDNGTNLAAIPAGQFVKHSLYIVGDGSDEEYFLVYGQTIFANLAAAQTGNLPTPPNYFSEGILPIAGIVVEQAVGVADILDIRPRPVSQAPATAGVTAHGSLSGLLNDDHPQYLLVDGTRAMSGNLQMGANNIITSGLVDGVDVSLHASRHIPSGADPLPTGVPVTLDSTPGNLAGVLNAFARQDHKHEINISSIQSAIDHNSLLNLAVGDVHTQYLPVNGSRSMTGTLNLAMNNVTNVGDLDADDVNTGTLTFPESAGVGPDTISISAPALAASYSLTLPVDDGTAGQVLSTDGAGVLSWVAAAVNDHHLLINLTTGDDHPQYFRTDGTRLMTGNIQANQNAITNATSLSLYNSTFTITLQPPVLAASYSLVLPPNDGNVGEFLQTDGSGNLSWFNLLGSANPFPQYFRIDGTSVMTGNIQVGGNNILMTGGDLNFGASGGDIINAVNVEIKSSVSAFSVNVSSPAGLVADWGLVLPPNAGAANQFLRTNGAGVTVWATPDHGQLAGLLDDDHPQYVLTNGGRVMTGSLNMGGNSIINVNLVDGVDVSAHASRHLPAGADPLTTAAPVTNLDNTTTNSTGTANSLARSDHTHALNIAAINSATDHGLLLGLTDDDHPQYFRTDGTRIMTGNINMNAGVGYGIRNVGELRMYTVGTGRSINIFSPVGMVADWTFTLPPNTGAVNQYLRTDGSGVSTWVTPDHGQLLGLLDDDHPQYLLINGTRAMTGDLDMDGNDLVDAGSLELRETGGGGDVVTISAPAALPASYNLVLPNNDGNVGEFLQTDGSGNLTWAAAGISTILPPYLELASDDFRNPTTADWAVNSLAPSIPDPTNSGIHVRAFDDSVEEGVGFSTRIPAGATAINLQIELRKQTAAAGNIIFNLYTRTINAGGVVSAWSLVGNSQLLPIIAGIADANWQYITMTSKLFTAYTAATRPVVGQTSQFQLTRSPSDTTTDDVYVGRVIVNFV